MNENNQETFITKLNDENQIVSMEFNDDDMNIDIKSSTNSEDTLIANTEIEDILNKKQPQNVSSILIPHVQSFNDEVENQMLVNNPSTSFADEPVQVVIPRSVYDYAAVVNQTLENPRQNKLDHDIITILGSSDPPPGFGFLHPRFYHLEQKRPIPLEPLQVWRGYNGHIYFSPIRVQPLDSDQGISPTKTLKSTVTQSVPLIRKPATERSNTILSLYKNRKLTTQKTNSINNERLSTKKRIPGETITNEKLTSAATFINEENNKQQESTKMWQSVVTCARIRIKPISKRSQNAIEDLQALQQEQTLQDPTGYNRQVLPNIRPVPKSKFVYKGLAYKESQKLPGINSENDNDGNPLQKPLVAYNLAQAYARYEINAARAKQSISQPPPTAATGAVIKDHQPSPLQQSHDLREMRKRIARGTTLAYRPPPQSVTWTPGRGDYRSTLGSETTVRRPSTSKSSIPQKQTTVVEMPILTKNIYQPQDSSRYTHTPDLFAAS